MDTSIEKLQKRIRELELQIETLKNTEGSKIPKNALQYNRRYKKINRNKINKRRREHYQKNKEKLRKQQRDYYRFKYNNDSEFREKEKKRQKKLYWSRS